MFKVFMIATISQLVIGSLMLVVGLVDQIVVKLRRCNSLMLPIWIGILAVVAGICGIVIGNIYQRRGLPLPSMVLGLRAINIVCAVIAYFSISCYGANFIVISKTNTELEYESDAFKKKISAMEGVTIVLIILSIAEMVFGAWLALLNKEGKSLVSRPAIQQYQKQQNEFQQVPLP